MSLGPGPFGNTDVFSAFYPLGCLVAYAKTHRDGALSEAFDFGRVTPTSSGELQAALDALPQEPGVFLLSSYVWNHAINMQFARAAKERWPTSLVVVGGPHIPRMQNRCEEFFSSHPYVDVAVRHEGEVTLAEVLDVIHLQGLDAGALTRADLAAVPGLTFRRGGELVRTEDRARQRDLASYPSPYTTGEFDHWLFDRRYIPLETNRGCPYGCTFCDWGAATLSKIAKMSLERVLAEIEFAARQRIYTIGFCDANFGVFPRDLDIVRYIIETKNRHGYPREVGYTNAKTANSRLTDIVRELRGAGLTLAGQISMQTTDETILKNVERANIKTSDYRKMIAFFHQEGIPAVSDMLLGLPGQTFDTCKKDLQFFFDHKVVAVIFATSVMPNAPMADDAYRKRFEIAVDEDGIVESTYSFTRADYARMFDLCLAYKLVVKLGVLKYLLYYLQVEHGVEAMDFVTRWLRKIDDAPGSLPRSARVKRDLVGHGYRGGRKDWLTLAWGDEQAAFLFDDFAAFQDEIVSFIEGEYDLSLQGSDVAAVLAANREVLPRKGRVLPASVPLEHDVPGYFAELRALPSVNDLPEGFQRLGDRPPGRLEIQARPECISYGFMDTGLTLGELELASNLCI